MNALPTIFLSHGSPLHAMEGGAAAKAWTKLARSLPRPRAILMVSAHWETNLPMLTANPKPETIHDFSGFSTRGSREFPCFSVVETANCDVVKTYPLDRTAPA